MQHGTQHSIQHDTQRSMQLLQGIGHVYVSVFE